MKSMKEEKFLRKYAGHIYTSPTTHFLEICAVESVNIPHWTLVRLIDLESEYMKTPSQVYSLFHRVDHFNKYRWALSGK